MGPIWGLDTSYIYLYYYYYYYYYYKVYNRRVGNI